MKVFFVCIVLSVPCSLWGQAKVPSNVLNLPKEEQSPERIDSWFGQDKAKHFVGSLLLVGAGSWWAKHHSGCAREGSIRFGMGFALSLGVAKELRDGQCPGGRFSWRDIVADLLGVSMGALLLGWW